MAEKTGWSERFILWELPLQRLVAYEHVVMRMGGVWTVPPVKAAGPIVALPPRFFDSADEEDE